MGLEPGDRLRLTDGVVEERIGDGEQFGAATQAAGSLVRICGPECARRWGYSSIMSSAEQQSEVLDLVIGADGSGVVDAAQLARLGVEPGTHLSVVPVGSARSGKRRRSVRGALAGSGPAPRPEDFEAASSAAVRDSTDRYRDGGAWDPATR